MSRSTITPPFDTTGLNPSQIAAVMSTAERLLVVAAAGSGKTRTLIARIQRMIADGIHPDSIVVVTFTNTAAAVLRKRLVCQACDGQGWTAGGAHPPEQIPCETCQGFEPQCNPTLGFCGTIHSLMLRLLQQHGTILGLPSKLTVVDEAEAEAMLVAAIERLAYKGTRKAVDEQVNLGLSRWMPDKFTSTPAGPRGLTDPERVAYSHYWTMMTTGCLTFNMILDIGILLIPRAEEELKQFQHICVDEAQDSSEQDWQIYQALPAKSWFIVGDPRQRIYSFRGACNRFEHMTNDVADEWTKLQLVENYRSGTEVVEAANRLMADHPPMRSATGTFGIVKVTAYDTAADEAAGIAEQIKGFNIYDNSQICQEHTPPSEIAVLCRTNKIANEMRAALKAHGIPIRERKQVDNPLDWATARAFIALLTNPENDRLAFKFLELKLGTEKAGQMRQDAADEYTTINDRWLHIRSMQLADVTTAMVSAKIERESVGRVRGLIEQLQPDSTVLELQAAVQAMEAEAQEESDGVTVSTAHASKGTEKQVVFVCAVEEGIWPSKREIEEDQGQESRRLMYVAVTRAKQVCAISYAKWREIQWKGVQPMQPSRFLKEIQP